MFSIFQKKNFLVDYLKDFTDFHNHLLPGIDDGAKDLADSRKMIKKFGEFGVTSFVASPHVMGEYYPNTGDKIKSVLEELRSELPKEIKIDAAAEYMMDQHLIEILEKEELLKVAGEHVLVEMSYFQPPINLNEILFKLQNRGYKPILAHPERYPFFHSIDLESYKDLKSRGCRFQLNMLSLTPHYGKGIQKMAFQLLENKMIDYISSDAHKMGHLEKIENIKLSKKQLKLIEPVIENSKQLF